MISDAADERALGDRNYLLLSLADGLRVFGVAFAVALFLTVRGESEPPDASRFLGGVALVLAMPPLLLGPLAGVLADRVCRRWLMGAGFVVGAGVMVLVASWAAPSPDRHAWGILVAISLLGGAATMSLPARLAYLPTLVDRRHLSRASAILCAVGASAAALATAAALHLVPQPSTETWFYVNAVFFACGAVIVLFIRPLRPGAARPGPIVADRGGLLGGLAYVACHRRVLALGATASAVCIVGGGLAGTGLLAFEAQSRPGHTGALRLVLLFAVGAGAASCLLSVFGDALRCGTAAMWSLLGLGAGTFALGILCRPIPWLAEWAEVGLLLLTGACTAAAMVSGSAMLQRIVPRHVRGRVFGMYVSLAAAGAVGGIGVVLWFGASRPGVGYGRVLPAATTIAFGSGVCVFLSRRHRSPFPAVEDFWRHLNEFYCRWWFRLERVGPCTIPREGPVIVAANHTCTIDPLLMIATNPRGYIGFLIAKEYHELPVVGRFTRMVECIPVRRDGQDVAGTLAAMRYLRSGRVLGVFPQGRIPEPDEVVEPKPGVAMLALATRVPVIPVNISGTRYSDSPALPFLRRHHARIRYGKPIDLSGYYGRHRDPVVLEEVSRLIMLRIQDLAPVRKSGEGP